jgi:hypothetical protein
MDRNDRQKGNAWIFENKLLSNQETKRVGFHYKKYSKK